MKYSKFPSESCVLSSAQISSLSCDKPEEDPFKRSGFIFGGVYREMQRRYAFYKSDFFDACSLHCLVSLIFMFIACLAPALTFGGIIGKFYVEHLFMCVLALDCHCL
jgi:hypothetical protein